MHSKYINKILEEAYKADRNTRQKIKELAVELTDRSARMANISIPFAQRLNSKLMEDV